MITVSQGTPVNNQNITTNLTAQPAVTSSSTQGQSTAASSSAQTATTDFSDVFDKVMGKSTSYKAAYVYVTPDGKVFDVGKEQGEQMIKNAVAQGYDPTVNGRMTAYDSAASGSGVKINGVAFQKTKEGRYDTVDTTSPLAVAKNPLPGAKAVTGKDDNTAIDIGVASKTAADNAVARLKAMGVTNYRVETLNQDMKDRIEKTADYYKQRNYTVSQMSQDLNPLKYSFDAVQLLTYLGDAFKLETAVAADTSKTTQSGNSK